MPISLFCPLSYKAEQVSSTLQTVRFLVTSSLAQSPPEVYPITIPSYLNQDSGGLINMQLIPLYLCSSPWQGLLAGSLLSMVHSGLWDFLNGICMQLVSLSFTMQQQALHHKIFTAPTCQMLRFRCPPKQRKILRVSLGIPHEQERSLCHSSLRHGVALFIFLSTGLTQILPRVS